MIINLNSYTPFFLLKPLLHVHKSRYSLYVASPAEPSQLSLNALQYLHYAFSVLLPLLVAQNLPQVNFFGYSFVKSFISAIEIGLLSCFHSFGPISHGHREGERDKISGNRWASYHLPWGLDSFRNLKRLRSFVMAGVFFAREWRRCTKGGGELNVRLSVCVALRTQYLSRVGFAPRRQWHHLAAVGAAMKTAK